VPLVFKSGLEGNLNFVVAAIAACICESRRGSLLSVIEFGTGGELKSPSCRMCSSREPTWVVLKEVCRQIMETKLAGN
jgi:hypothetical protein